MGRRLRRGDARRLDGRSRQTGTRAPTALRSPPARGVFSCRGGDGPDPDSLAGVPEVEGAGAPRPTDPHLRPAGEVRGGARGGEPARARGRAGPRLVRAPRPHRRHRALRPVARDQVRDVRDGPDSRRDHRRAPLARLGPALRAHAGASDRARDRDAREGAPPRADRRGDREEARSLRGGARRQPARDLAFLRRGAGRAVVAVGQRRLDRADRHDRGRVRPRPGALARADRGDARRSPRRSPTSPSARSWS